MFSEGSGRGLAHPRACGENVERGLHRCGGEGSSPRVRGKLDGVDGGAGHVRLIPARAGKTRARPGRKRFRRAHPRACGENAGADPRCVNEVGSSPRVRGKPRRRPRKRVPPRLIPARAGKTRPGTAPRSAGRLIPARAGKTRCPPSPRRSRRAHPRACGENRVPTAPPSGGAGSSPRVRGKRRGSYRVIPTGGLIPARAGKTSSGRLAPSCVWAHPRACGENYKNLTLVELEEGSSPRVRGKPGGC